MSTTQSEVPISDQFDAVGFVIDYETGELDHEQIVEGFQHLIDSGLAWQLQGSYGRGAAALIEQGYCHDNREQK